VWKFENFPVSEIFCEIDFREIRRAKSAILAHLEALNLDFNEFLHFLKAAIDQMNKVQNQKNCKLAVLELLASPELISRKI